MSKEQLSTAVLEALKTRAAELGAPLSDEDAAAMGVFMAGADQDDAEVTEDKYNAGMEQMNTLPKEGLEQMLGMVKTMNAIPAAAAAKQPATAEAEVRLPSLVECTSACRCG